MGKAVVTARAEAARAALTVHRKHVGVAGQHPAGRSSGGGAQHNLEASRAKGFDGTVEPGKLELPGRGFHPRPVKFADAHPGEANGGHAGGIRRPLRLGPVFGVVADAKGSLHRITLCSESPRATPGMANVWPA